MLDLFEKETEINFELFDKDYMSVYEVFNQTSQLPFGLEKELNKQIDVRRFQEKPGGAASNKRQGVNRWAGGAAGRGASTAEGASKQGGIEDEEEADPEWIQFDPET